MCTATKCALPQPAGGSRPEPAENRGTRTLRAGPDLVCSFGDRTLRRRHYHAETFAMDAERLHVIGPLLLALAMACADESGRVPGIPQAGDADGGADGPRSD